MNADRLQDLVLRWKLTLLRRDLAYAIAAGAAGTAASLLAGSSNRAWTYGFVTAFAVLAVRFAVTRWWEIDKDRLANHLDRSYPELEESSHLWIRPPAELTLIERMQRQRIDRAFLTSTGRSGPLPGEPPRALLLPAIICSLAGMLALAAAAEHRELSRRQTNAAARKAAVAAAAQQPSQDIPAWPRIIGGELTITPPAYTGRPARRVQTLSSEMEEDSAVEWNLALDRPVREARIVFGEAAQANAPVSVSRDGRSLTVTRHVAETSLYHLAGKTADGRQWNPPEIYSLKVIKDAPPTVRTTEPAAARTIIDPSEGGGSFPPAEIEIMAADDYGITDAHLVATVAKGSGEAVKFREQTIPFDSAQPDPAAPHGMRFHRKIDFSSLGMEPGDELYFYAEVSDNREPVRNRTRSETRFLVLRGPAETAPVEGRWMSGVNLVPQYFRSERQIIIDTEKLIADRARLSDQELRQRANDLGGDQQLLRLRYGQFLGEDLEPGLGDHAEVALDPLQAAPPEQAAGPRAAASIVMRFRQEHEEQDREGGTDEQREAGAHAAPDVPLTSNQVIAPYVDQHDSQDKATFFDHETKGTMREALDAMWAAERHLRVVQLDSALAPEHRALDILKDLQQSARAYVQHVGFEPPPLKTAERRLRGEVTDVPARPAVADTLPPGDPHLEQVRAALAALPWHAAGPILLTPAQTNLLNAVQPTLTQAATSHPETYLQGLQALRQSLAAAQAQQAGPLPAVLEQALLRLLPAAVPLPEVDGLSYPVLGQAYRASLSATPISGGISP